MKTRTQLAPKEPAEWLGSWHPLAEQLGSADGLLTLASVSAFLRVAPAHDLASLRRFLGRYHSRVLLPLELPAIQTAHGHAMSNELRELVQLDQSLAQEGFVKRFAEASRRIGVAQLRKLRPLRDQRTVQRYLLAVERGDAHGWHTLVYGLTLAVYSLPLRQALLGYAHAATRSFIDASARRLGLSERTCGSLVEELWGGLSNAVEDLLRQREAA